MIASPPIQAERTAFLTAVRRSDLLTPDQFDRAAAALPADAHTAKQAAGHLVQSGALTRFQAHRLLAGKADGFLLGQYVILELLGAGPVGRVFKARHRAMNRLVTIELLSPTWSQSKSAREEFHREARSAARLAHPNLVTILDANQAGDRLYLVLEYVDGTTLDAAVRSAGPMPVGQACESIRQAALGLAHAHDKGLAHGNLSPASVLVGRPGGTGPTGRPVVKVLNVGLNRLAVFAAATGDLHAAAAAAEYLAPEQLAHPDRADAKADLYALGCTLYFLLTGKPPRPAEALADGPLLHQLGPAVPVEEVRPDVPEEVAAVVRQLMGPNPARRPTAAEVAARLTPFADGEGNSSNVEFALPPAGAMTGFLGTPPAALEASPFAGLMDDDPAESILSDAELLARTTRPTRGATAGLITLAAAVIAATGMAVAVLLRSVAR